MKHIVYLLILTSLSLTTIKSHAASGGGHGINLGLAVTTTTQDDLSNWGKGLGSQAMGSGTEFSFSYSYRFQSSMFAVLFRPSYFTQSSSGTASASLTGLTLYPLLRMYPLENNFIHFFMQFGLGYGSLDGTISNGSANSAKFSGYSYGTMVGLGSEFCFTDRQCVTVEGNVRYHPIQRSIVSSSTGTLGGNMTRQGAGQELEYFNADVQNSLSGVIGQISYSLKF